MTIQCPACGARYRVNREKAAASTARVKCPKCSNLFLIDLGKEVVKASPAPPAGRKPPPPQPRVAKVLVVDDSRYFRDLVVDVLKPLGLSFSTAADSTQALEAVRRERPDLVILDLNLPGMNGYELILELRANPALKGMRLLAMSGVYRTRADSVEAERAGADDFLNKSFRPEQLQERVRKLLEK